MGVRTKFQRDHLGPLREKSKSEVNSSQFLSTQKGGGGNLREGY